MQTTWQINRPPTHLKVNLTKITREYSIYGLEEDSYKLVWE
jgi:hypothetical protein